MAICRGRFVWWRRSSAPAKIWRLWRDEFGPEPPFPIGADALFVSFTASAELGCFLALGWPMPARILDLSAEYRLLRNLDYPRGTPKELREKKGLVDACRFFGISAIGAGEKSVIRRRILEGEPFSEEEREAILDYCSGDVFPLEKLLVAMGPHIDLPRALLRGRHEITVATIENIGIPTDVEMLTAFRENWTRIQDDLIAKLDADFHVYEGRSFRRDRFAALLTRLGIKNWPLLDSGQLDLEDKTLRDMAKAYPGLAPLRELRHSLSSLRLDALAVGEDGRARAKLWPYSTKTGRNLPAPDEFIFGPSCWLRGLIKPRPVSASPTSIGRRRRWDRRRPVGRRKPDGGLSVRGFVHRLWRCRGGVAEGGDQEDPQSSARNAEAMRARDLVRHGASDTRVQDRKLRAYGPLADRGA